MMTPWTCVGRLARGQERLPSGKVGADAAEAGCFQVREVFTGPSWVLDNQL